MQQIKGKMVERLHSVHREQMVKAAQGYEEQLGVRKHEMGRLESELTQLSSELEMVLEEKKDHKRKTLLLQTGRSRSILTAIALT